MKRRLLVFLGALVLLGSLFGGCDSPSVALESSVVPYKANAIAALSVAEIINDEDVAELHALFAAASGNPNIPPTLEEAMEQFERGTGLHPRYCDQLTLFADLSTIGDSDPYYGALVRFKIPAEHLLGIYSALRKTDFPTVEHGEYDIRLVDTSLSFAFLTTDLVIAGPLHVVEDVLDTRLGMMPALDAAIGDAHARLADAPLSLALEVPAEVKASIPDLLNEDGVVTDLSPLKDISVVAVEVHKDADYFVAEAQLVSGDSLSAEWVEALVRNDLERSVRMFGSPEIKTMLQTVFVSREGLVVSMNLSATASDVKDLVYAAPWVGYIDRGT